MKRVLIFLKSRFYDSFDEHMKEVVQGAGVTFVVKIASAGFAFGFNILLARYLGAGGAGIYFLALTMTTIAVTLGRFGLENTTLRFVAAHAAREEWREVKGVFRKSMSISLVAASIVSVSLFVFAPQLSDLVFSKLELVLPLRVMALAIVPMSLFWLAAEALKGLKQIYNSQLVQGLAFPALACIGLVLIGNNWGVVGAASVHLIAAFAVLVISGIFWLRSTPHLRKIAPAFSTENVLDSCVPLLWVQLMSLIMQWAPIFFLGVWGSSSEVGLFSAAARTAMMTNFILASVNSIVAPKFAALYSCGDMEGLASTARNSTKMMTGFAVPILLFFLLAPDVVMGLFGQGFSKSGPLLAIMALGQFVNVATGSVGYLLTMTGNEKLMRNNTVVVGLAAIFLNMLIIPVWGVYGAALVSAISTAVFNLGAFFLVWRRLGIWTLPIGRHLG